MPIAYVLVYDIGAHSRTGRNRLLKGYLTIWMALPLGCGLLKDHMSPPPPLPSRKTTIPVLVTHHAFISSLDEDNPSTEGFAIKHSTAVRGGYRQLVLYGERPRAAYQTSDGRAMRHVLPDWTTS